MHLFPKVDMEDHKVERKILWKSNFWKDKKK